MFKTKFSIGEILPGLKQKVAVMLFGMVISVPSFAQSEELSLDSCLVKAERNYPLITQYQLMERTQEFTLSNLGKEKLPRITLVGQASYQSDVTSLPGGMPGVTPLSKDQYRLYGEVVQPLTDLALVDHKKKMTEASHELSKKDLEVKLYPIKEKVSELYFGILLLENREEQIDLAIQNLETGLNQLNAAVSYGTALRSSVNLLKAERLVMQQRKTEIISARKAYLEMLGLFINQDLAINAALVRPEVDVSSNGIQRPELDFFDANIRYQALAQEFIDKNNRPKFSLFLQSGFGRPALNFLSNDFEPYYVGGLRLSWRLSDYYSSSGQKQLFTINQQMVNASKETFLFNTTLAMRSQQVEIQKMETLLAQDIELIQLREEIMTTAQEQLAHGVITAHDYKSVVLAADGARQAKVQHEIELLRTKHTYKLTTGN